jgi:sulfate permease, SulP family
MTNFERPLLALSLTDQDASLLQYAALMVQRQAWNDVHFAHVAAENAHEWLEPLQKEVERYFGQNAPSVRHSLHAAEGARLDQIVRLAVEHQRDLIMLGHRRMRSGRRALARRLAMVSPASVWLVPEGAAAKVSSILVPVDFSESSADALSVAIGIARANGLGMLHAVHVFFDPSTVRYDEHVQEILGEESAALEQFIAGIDRQGVEVEPLLVEGTRTADDILRTAQRYHSDLIVMNTRGRSQAASVLLGSTTSETMAATTVPLLAVKHYGSRMSLMEALVNHRIWDQPTPKTN